MKVVSIDPGTTYLGWAAFTDKALDAHGCEHFKGKFSGVKLASIGKFIVDLLDKYTPDYLVLEKYFTQGSAKGAGVVPELRGSIRYIWASRTGKELEEVHPSTVKLQVAGSGRASKEDVKSTIVSTYKIIVGKNLDETDAIAQGYTWIKLNSGRISE